MNNDLISRSALKDAVEKRIWYIAPAYDEIMSIIDNAPTIHHPNCDTCEGLAKQYSIGFQDGFLTGKERPQGEWGEIFHHQGYNYHKCPHCCYGIKLSDYDNFCPNCGADMRSE